MKDDFWPKEEREIKQVYNKQEKHDKRRNTPRKGLNKEEAIASVKQIYIDLLSNKAKTNKIKKPKEKISLPGKKERSV